MPSMSQEELYAILELAAHMARLDREIVVFEVEILDRLAGVAGLNEVSRQELAGAGYSPEESLAKVTSPEGREFLVKTLCAIAYSDGRMHQVEVDFVESVNHGFGNPVSLVPWEEWESYILEVVDRTNALQEQQG